MDGLQIKSDRPYAIYSLFQSNEKTSKHKLAFKGLTVCVGALFGRSSVIVWSLGLRSVHLQCALAVCLQIQARSEDAHVVGTCIFVYM